MNLTLIEAEIDHLEGYEKKGDTYTNDKGSYGWRNPIRKDTGRILQSIVLSSQPNRILEIGTAHGLSALYLLSGFKKNSTATIDTIEFDLNVAADTQKRFQSMQLPVNVYAQEAMQAIQSMTEPFDLVFFDAQKSHYYKQLLLLLEKKLIRNGTILLADNVIDRKEECLDFLQWFIDNKTDHCIINTECGLLIARI